jgi:small-conductance mechanosensitive channel
MDKPLWQSKAIWGSALIAVGAFFGLYTQVIDLQSFTVLMGNALGIAGIRTALK